MKMKKKSIILGLCCLLLIVCSACTKQSSKHSSKSNHQVKSVKEISQKEFQDLANSKRLIVNQNPPKYDFLKDARLESARNGLVETDINGEVKHHYRWYEKPDLWTLNVNTKDKDRDLVYDAREHDSTFIVQLYTLNAYSQSPLDGGHVLTEQELSERLKKDLHYFSKETKITIENQEWHVGYEKNTSNNSSRLTFYRVENTGNFDDSVVVGAIIFPLASSKKATKANLKEAIGHLKDILYQISKK